MQQLTVPALSCAHAGVGGHPCDNHNHNTPTPLRGPCAPAGAAQLLHPSRVVLGRAARRGWGVAVGVWRAAAQRPQKQQRPAGPAPVCQRGCNATDDHYHRGCVAYRQASQTGKCMLPAVCVFPPETCGWHCGGCTGRALPVVAVESAKAHAAVGCGAHQTRPSPWRRNPHGGGAFAGLGAGCMAPYTPVGGSIRCNAGQGAFGNGGMCQSQHPPQRHHLHIHITSTPIMYRNNDNDYIKPAACRATSPSPGACRARRPPHPPTQPQ